VPALKAVNPGVDPRKLQLGQKIKVPAPAPVAAGTPTAHDASVYVVKSGDFLGRIATKHKTTVARLREVNGLSSDRIRVGQKLKLPPEARH
jgi:LysM repeat protein